MMPLPDNETDRAILLMSCVEDYLDEKGLWALLDIPGLLSPLQRFFAEQMAQRWQNAHKRVRPRN